MIKEDEGPYCDGFVALKRIIIGMGFAMALNELIEMLLSEYSN